VLIQIFFTYARNKSGPKTLPCGTPDVTPTCFESWPSTLTHCVWPTRNSLTYTLVQGVCNFLACCDDLTFTRVTRFKIALSLI
jgi:hypothetical protein